MPNCAVALGSVIVLMIVWGSTYAVTKVTVREIPPLALGALRFAIAAVVLVPAAAARGGLTRLPRPLPLRPLVMMGITGVALFHIAFNVALMEASASQGAIIYGLVPAVVAIAAVLFLEEKLSRRRVVGIVLSIAGVIIVIAGGETSGHSPHPFLGAVWMLSAVVAWGAYTVFAKRLADADQVVVIACTTVIGLAVMMPPAIWELRDSAWPQPSMQGWLGALFLGVVASAVAFIVYNHALRVLDASLVGAFVNLDPVVGVFIAVVFLGESLQASHLGGGAIVLAGVWLASSQAAASHGSAG